MYTSDYFNIVDRSYNNFDAVRFKTVALNVEKVAIALGAKRGYIDPISGVCLDAGSGGGHYLGFLSSVFSRTVGIEWSKDGIKDSKKRVAKSAVLNGDLTKRLPFKDKSFDFILCSEVLEHLEGVGFVLSEFKRVLKDSGKLLITVPNFTKLSFEYIREIVSYKDPTHVHRNSFCWWASLLKKYFYIEKSFTSSFHTSFPLYLGGLGVDKIIRTEDFIRRFPIFKILGRECVFVLSKN